MYQQSSDADFEKALQSEENFIPYLRLLRERMHNYTIFIMASDTPAGPSFPPAYAKELMETFNLQTNLVDKYRMGYVAVIERGKVVLEQLARNPRVPVVVQGKFNDKDLFLYSGGFRTEGKFSTYGVLMIDNETKMLAPRGLSFVVYDSRNNNMINTYSYDCFNKLASINTFKYKDKLTQLITSVGAELILLRPPMFFPDSNGSLTRYQKFIIDRFRRGKTILDEYEEVFANDLSPLVKYCKTSEDLKDLFTAPPSHIGVDGARYYEDYHTHLLNTKDGRRLTTDQPEEYDHSVYIFGGCIYFGFGVPDKHTLASYLQRKLNDNGKKFIVHNYGEFLADIKAGGIPEGLALLNNSLLKKGDIVIFDYPCPLPGVTYLDLIAKGEKVKAYGELFWDQGHLAPEGNRFIADNIYDLLEKKNLLNPPLSNEPIAVKNIFRIASINSINEKIAPNLDDNAKKLLIAHKQKLREFYSQNIEEKIGCCVMNCNPFTLGHRYLVEEALKRCDKLIVFVVEEDRSFFPFKDRFKLVEDNLADLENVYVLPSGSFVISSRTFSEYFNKESLQDRTVDTTLDVTLFALEIAPCMGITRRFAGEEPFDTVTNQYNRNMDKLLPRYGIEFIEIPRLKQKNIPVNATEVRQLLKEKDFEKLKYLVPEKTLKYLRNFHISDNILR